MIALIVFLQALFAIIFPLGKMALVYAGPFFLVGLRMIIAGLVLLIYQFFADRKHFVFYKKDILRLLLLAFFNIYITNSFEFWGLQFLGSGKACFIYNLTPFFDAIISYFMFHEKMTVKKFIGLAIGFLGFLPIVYYQGGGEIDLPHVGIFSLAEIALIIAAGTTAIGWIIMRTFSRNPDYSIVTVNALSMILGGGMSLIHSGFVENWTPAPYTAFIPMIALTLIMGFIQNIVCYNLYGWLLRRYSSTLISFIGFTGPFFAAFFGWLIHGEQVSHEFYSAGIIVFIGLTMYYQEELRLGYIVEPE
jgi:drug/metabolite transporter (DMT)-like permease